MGAVDFYCEVEGENAQDAFTQAQGWMLCIGMGIAVIPALLPKRCRSKMFGCPTHGATARDVADAIWIDEHSRNDNDRLVELGYTKDMAWDIANTYFDKWGDALCIKTGDKSYAFAGIASV